MHCFLCINCSVFMLASRGGKNHGVKMADVADVKTGCDTREVDGIPCPLWLGT